MPGPPQRDARFSRAPSGDNGLIGTLKKLHFASMSASVRSELIGTAGLAVAAIAAVLLTVLRVPLAARDDERRRTTTLLCLGLVFQSLHFAEEYATRFFDRFPPVLGISPWSATFFAVFNLCWIVIWICAAFGLQAGYRSAFFPVWFFAIAAIANGLAHPLLSLRVGGYFPGLLTSPFLGVVGVLLLSRLIAETTSRRRAVRARPANEVTG
jgi:hypothetical protein